MAKNKRTDRRTGDHKKGSSAKKPGPKITSKGKQRSKRVALGIAAGKNLAQKKKNAHFMAALALARGEFNQVNQGHDQWGGVQLRSARSRAS